MKKVRLHCLMVITLLVSLSHGHDAKELINASGVKGGLVVHLGCGDGRLTAGLRINDRYLVHGLDRDAAKVQQARSILQSKQSYGLVSIDTLHATELPYADNLVNLLVVTERGKVSLNECIRVLAPDGVILSSEPVPGDNKLIPVSIGTHSWYKLVKPRSLDIDEWTHYLYDAGGNAVARDRVVGPPQSLQWMAEPRWARSHGWTPSVSAMVSAGGRLFYICDESLACVDATVPSKWFLVARDAFSGVLLWKCPVPQWDARDHSATPDTGHGISVGRFTMPSHLGKRLVAVDDTVYVTLGATAPVTALDAATGKIKQIYEGTERTDEILCTEGRLIVSINPTSDLRPAPVPKDQSPPPAPGKQVRGIDIETGDTLWERGLFQGIRAGRGQDPFGRLELVAGDGKAFLLTTKSIEAMAIDTGKTLWCIDRPVLPTGAVRKLGFAGMYEFLLTVMVYNQGVVLLAQPEPNTHHTYHTMPGTLYAYDAKDGRLLWRHAYGGWGHCTPPDVFVVGDTVWTHVNADTEFGKVWGNGYKAKDSNKVDYRIQGLDLRRGTLRQELATKDVFNVGHHHRCYRNRITERFLLSSRRGVEFVDLSSGENYQNHWVRSGCLLGNLPCNGLVYVAPHPCACYMDAKLTGFNALSPAGRRMAGRGLKTEDRERKTERLEKGPAFGKITDHGSQITDGEVWPTYRHDGRRSGCAESTIHPNLKPVWQTDIGTIPSGLVVADGKVLVAGLDTHSVFALDAENGRRLWTYTTGARVDSPPSFYQGRALFGSRDGFVYCLRVSDGVLVWRFQAAPAQRFVTVEGQLESAWPIPGSVLMHHDQCWFAAGRSSYLDGGIYVYALDPISGKVLFQDNIYHPNPQTGRTVPEPDAHRMVGLLNDVLVSDGDNVYTRQMRVSPPGHRESPHLYAAGGYLDASWFNRTFWKFGRAQTSGLLVFDKENAYGMEGYASRSRETVFKPGSQPYRLQCLSLTPPPKSQKAKQNRKPNRTKGIKPQWEQRLGIRVTALIRAGHHIIAAGSPDIVEPVDPHGAWEGRMGGRMAVFSVSDGSRRADYKLPTPPVWDGMAIAYDRVYISLLNGSVICFKATGNKTSL